MEQEIIKYLQNKYGAEVIILEGSRAAGQERADSDWDLYVFTYDSKHKSGRDQFEGQSLDVVVKHLPLENESMLQNSYGPLRAMRVLLDNKEMFGQILVTATEERIHQPRPALTTEELTNRKIRLQGLLNKMAHTSGALENFYYTALFYELVMRYWFEVHQLWTLHPREAVPCMQERDPGFVSLLETFVREGHKEARDRNARAIYEKLFLTE